MDDVIAERTLELLAEGASTPSTIVVQLGRPVRDGQDFRTPYEIRGPAPDEVRARSIFGVDAVQSLFLAMQTIGAELTAYGRRGRLTFLGEADLGFPLPTG
ncbi:MAG: hypothetical protein QM820_19175 [Minicystis sp.]